MEEANSNSQAFVAHSFTPKRFTHLCRALYGDVILVHIPIPFCCTNMAAGNQQNHLEFIFSIKALSFHSRTSIRTHKHIFLYLQWLYCWKSRRETFPRRQHSYFGSNSNCCIFEMKHVTGMKTCTEIYFLFIFNLVK